MPHYECDLADLPGLLEEHATLRKKTLKKAVAKSARELKTLIESRAQNRTSGEAAEDGRLPVVTGALLRSGEVVPTDDGAQLTYDVPYAGKVERRRRFVMAAMPEYLEILDKNVRDALGKR